MTGTDYVFVVIAVAVLIYLISAVVRTGRGS